MGVGIFGSSSEKKTTVTTQTTPITQDQRVAVGGSAGTLISPGATVGGQGTVSAAPYASVTQTISNEGLKPAEVQAMLDTMFTQTSADRAAMSDLAGSLSSGLQETARGLSDVVAATKAPEQTALTSVLPVLALGLLLVMLWGK